MNIFLASIPLFNTRLYSFLKVFNNFVILCCATLNQLFPIFSGISFYYWSLVFIVKFIWSILEHIGSPRRNGYAFEHNDTRINI